MAAPSARRVEQLRFIACGSVDDGKSTLMGRLLHDSKNLFSDQLKALRLASKGGLNLALLTDGLRAEREEGITIDVAYRFFATPRRRFIIADTPGHFELTRNMATAASTADLALLLVDATQGLLDQTRRHALIASLLRIPHVVVCVNKMDLVGYKREVFDAVREDFMAFASKLEVPDVRFVPVCATDGDNVVERSRSMPWYQGATLLYHLEDVPVAADHNLIDCRFPVQSVIPGRGGAPLYAGRVAGGVFRKGDLLRALPSGRPVTLRAIETFDGSLREAFAPQSVAFGLKERLKLTRGCMLVRRQNVPRQGRELDAMLCWLDARPLKRGRRLILRHTTRETSCTVGEIRYELDIRTLHRRQGRKSLPPNGIGRVSLRASQPLFYDSYRRNKATGSLILIDEKTGRTVAAGMIL